MRPFLRELLRCPACRGRLTAEVFVTDPHDQRVVEGLLRCGCGACFPVIGTIPRMLVNAQELFPDFARRHGVRLGTGSGGDRAGRHGASLSRTRKSFGYQWTAFSEMSCDFADNFWNYLAPATPDFFRGKVGADIGCGFGRHLYHAARYCDEIVGVDFSRAIEATDRNTKHLANVHLVQADLYALPFPDACFDFVYSVGVLHHLPDPGRGMASLVPLLRPGGTLFVWLYSTSRRVLNFLLECVRAVTTRCPHPLVQGLSWAAALVDYGGFVWPYRCLHAMPFLGRLIERLAPARIKLYSAYPFQVLYADWFDRLAAPIRYYYDEEGVRGLLIRAGVSDIQVTPTGLYGWRGCGMRPASQIRRDESTGTLSRKGTDG